jgi:hypothetical protein
MNMRKYVERDDFLMKECNLYYNVTIIIMHIFSITWLRLLVTSDFLRLSSLMLCPQLGMVKPDTIKLIFVAFLLSKALTSKSQDWLSRSQENVRMLAEYTST